MSGEPSIKSASERVKRLADLLYPYHIRYERIRDERAIFAYVYYHITLDLFRKLEKPDSEFEDPEWVADLAHAFGSKYMAAMDAIDAWLVKEDPFLNDPETFATIYETVPRPWADVFRAICCEQSYVLEDLVFSMMAHISYDLPHALLQIAHEHHRLLDYHLMNDVLASRMESIQDDVAKRYDHFLIRLDELAGSFDEFHTNYGIRGARAVAWYNAMRLSAANSRKQAEASIERSTHLFIKSVRSPEEWWQRLLVRFFRFILPRRRTWPAPATIHADPSEESTPA